MLIFGKRLDTMPEAQALRTYRVGSLRFAYGRTQEGGKGTQLVRPIPGLSGESRPRYALILPSLTAFRTTR